MNLHSQPRPSLPCMTMVFPEQKIKEHITYYPNIYEMEITVIKIKNITSLLSEAFVRSIKSPYECDVCTTSSAVAITWLACKNPHWLFREFSLVKTTTSESLKCSWEHVSK